MHFSETIKLQFEKKKKKKNTIQLLQLFSIIVWLPPIFFLDSNSPCCFSRIVRNRTIESNSVLAKIAYVCGLAHDLYKAMPNAYSSDQFSPAYKQLLFTNLILYSLAAKKFPFS